jgi:hypothetical protein
MNGETLFARVAPATELTYTELSMHLVELPPRYFLPSGENEPAASGSGKPVRFDQELGKTG